jgi:hypothetical protein
MSRRPLLFRALNTSKRNVHVSLSEWADAFLEPVRREDLVVESLGPGTLEHLGLQPSEPSAANDSLVVVRISVAGQHGPYRDRRLTDLTLQAMGAGSRPTVCRAAIAARDLREQVVVDVSMLECLVGTLAYPTSFNETLKRWACRHRTDATRRGRRRGD